MGITNLAKLIGDCAANAIKENEMKNYFGTFFLFFYFILLKFIKILKGRKIAIDASMCIYQFLIAVRQDGNALTNENGETTSHLMGMFYRTIRLMDNGIKPLYVFDGKPPTLKGGELQKRKERRAEAEENLEKATEAGDAESVEKFSRRLVKVTTEHADDCRKLLKLMGVPYVDVSENSVFNN
jgi:flap endonuclease-1